MRRRRVDELPISRAVGSDWGLCALGASGADPFPAGIGVGDVGAGGIAAQDHDEAVFADMLDEDLGALDPDLLELWTTARAGSLAIRPARRSVIRPCASTVQKLPRAATSFGLQIEVDAERLEHPAADLVLDRIVAEQAEMARPAAGRDAGADRDRQAADIVPDQGIEIRGRGGLELGRAAGLDRQPAEAVGDREHDLAGVAEDERLDQVEHVLKSRGSPRPVKPGLGRAPT